jgi:hypothetical protein
MAVSNKTLSIILVATMFIALFGAMIAWNRINGISDWGTLTGAWNGPGDNSTYGSVNLSITSQLQINFTLDNSSFGSGYINPGQAACVLSTGLTAVDTRCNSFNPPGSVKGLYLENIGNEYANLSIANMYYSATLLGGLNPGYAWKWTPETAGNVTCNTTTKDVDLPSPEELQNLTVTNYPGEIGTAVGKTLCSIFNYTATSNAINITFVLDIPQNAPPATLSDIWFAYADAVV